MPYVRAETESGNIIEISRYYSGRIGSKSAKKEIKEMQATPEKQKAWQRKNAEKKVWRLLRENFAPGDLWVTLTYPKGKRPTPQEVRNDVRAWLARMRRLYKKHNLELKYILTAGRGKHGAAHIHLVINAGVPIEMASWAWEDITGGRINSFKPLDRSRDWRQIAAYIIKNSDEDLRSPEPVYKKRYSASRNLVMPKTKRRISRAESWRENPPQKAGYYIDSDLSYTAIEETESGRMVKRQYTVYVRLNPKEDTDERHESRKSGKTRRRRNSGRKSHKATRRSKNQKPPARRDT